jgi:NAD(P)H dehydrogenase (quinone)
MTSDRASAVRADEPALLITGAAGKTGGHAARLLIERGHRVRALVRRFDDRAAALRNAGAEVIVGDLTNISDVRRAAEGARAAYFVYPISPGLLEATTTFAQAAHEAGVNSVVNMSQISARRDATSNAARIHWLAERVLDWSPLAVTHLRPTFFAEWFIFFGRSLRDEGVLRLPFGDGRHAPITAEDQGRVIAAILDNPDEHAGQIYPLFGAIEMNHYQIADAISRAAGRPVRYEPADIDTWVEDIQAHGSPSFLAQHLGQVAVDYQNGIFAGTNDIVERVGGKAPMTVEEFVAANIEDFVAA